MGNERRTKVSARNEGGELEARQPKSLGAPSGVPLQGGIRDPQENGGHKVTADPIIDHLLVDFEGFSDPARAKFSEFVKQLAKSLANEAARLEVADRDQAADFVEINATMVIKANEVLRRPAPSAELPPRSIKTLIIYSVVLVATLAAGATGNYLHSTWQVALFLASALIALVGGIHAYRRRL
jgi:hypothetical protein